MSETLLLSDPLHAADLLLRGRVVALPTETVYGLAARFDDPAAVARIFQAKGRPSDNPLIVHLATIAWLDRVTSCVPPLATELLARFAPGPLTVTVPRSANVSDAVTAGLTSVAVRIPDHQLIQAVLQALDIPLVAPSANRSSRPSPTTWQAVRDELDGLIDGILIGPPTTIGLESTVVDCCSQPPRLLRPGGISFEQLLETVPNLQLYRPDSADLADVASPGLRYRHYSPRCHVHLVADIGSVSPDASAALLALTAHPQAAAFAWTRIYPTSEAYAAELFAAFRQADLDGLTSLYCQQVPEAGIGRAIMDRLRRASLGSQP